MNNLSLTHSEPATLTMNSREIAELTDKRHPDVKRDIEVMMDQLHEDVSKFARTYLDSMNRRQVNYILGRDHTECLITGYNAQLRMKVIKRLHELEDSSRVQLTLPEALRLAADVAEQKLALECQLADAAPKVEFADRVTGISKGISIPNFAKTVGVGPHKLFAWMRDNHILIKDGQRYNLPAQRFIDCGYFAVRQGSYVAYGETRASFTTMLTGKGEVWLVKRLVDAGVLKGDK
ncbi:phage antirepressor KilAC domain-containing protein [Erwiniaceae bacterium BAC15a-03b]|uniref:Phage antirepressor KilAC domain-containing protein n=1 Tax=Winslowiella arboricola TaxID=2978220 RepID=A0A9J6PDM5_9GAMM|nr:phage antirepressor KilAC domain-containing protein [Winslowiella arboricola]MCU5776345.1 phage antirepressor KilAC domain-containing protein [Winslowiella arboricola]